MAHTIYILGYTTEEEMKEGISPINLGGVSTIDDFARIVVGEGLFLEYFEDDPMDTLSEEQALSKLTGHNNAVSELEDLKARFRNDPSFDEAYLDWYNNR